jgi:hypothetical protein
MFVGSMRYDESNKWLLGEAHLFFSCCFANKY